MARFKFVWLLCAPSVRAVTLSHSATQAQTTSLADGLKMLHSRQPLPENANKKPHKHKKDLVLMHVPYNFGHTIEKVALFNPSVDRIEVNGFIQTYLNGFGSNKAGNQEMAKKKLENHIEHVKRHGGEAWGHFNPDLQEISNVTGCSLFFSPQKYWPKDVAKKYFGDKKVFGLLRDPYERLVAMFRGSASLSAMGEGNEYGNIFDPKYVAACDVNNAIKHAMKEFKKSGNMFKSSCTFIPQAEYFEGEYGIKKPVDNLHFPSSMNKLFEAHGYDWKIRTQDIFHVSGCNHVWAANLDAETKGLIRDIYRKDFDLQCEHFGYCHLDKNTCLNEVPQMCPPQVCMVPGTNCNMAIFEDDKVGAGREAEAADAEFWIPLNITSIPAAQLFKKSPTL